MRANWQELKEERKMCEALRELFADDLRESKEEGIMEGRNVGKLEGKLEGAASKVIEIVIKKYKKGCSVKEMILSILVDTFISKISFPMQPGPEIGSISDA